MNEQEELKTLDGVDVSLVKSFLNGNQDFDIVITMQDDMNKRAIHYNWVFGENKNTVPVRFDMASIAEIGELIGSSKYKWWKSGNEDLENMITEAIDVLHFEISRLMLTYSEELDNNLINALLTTCWMQTDVVISQTEIDTLSESDRYMLFADLIKKLTFFISMPDEFKPENIMEWHIAIFVGLFDIFKFFGVSKEEVISRYKTKNILNVFRNKNGYKEGTYIKMWMNTFTGYEVEDNVMALELAKKNKELGLEELEAVLQDYYNEFVTVIG